MCCFTKDIDSCFEFIKDIKTKQKTKCKSLAVKGNAWVGASAVLWDINENIPKKFITELRKRNICIVTLTIQQKKIIL